MAMQCSRCSHIADDSVKICPQCSGPMRYTLLGGLKHDAAPEKVVKIKRDIPTGVGPRLRQWAYGITWFHVLAAILLLARNFSATAAGIPAAELPQKHHAMWVLTAFAIPPVATMLAVRIAFLRLYLAQLVGLAVGLTGSLALLGELSLLSIPVAWYEWVISPVLCGAAGFWMGLRVAGRLVVEEAAEYKPIDAWDRATKPKKVEITPSVNTRWRQLIFGIVVGLLAPFLLSLLLRQAINPIYNFNRPLVDATVERASTAVAAVSLLLAGVIAGSGTQAGFVQGLLTGCALFAIRYFFSPPETHHDFAMLLGSSLLIATIGGMIGRRVFRPWQVYHGPRTK